jgi:hypothetical protein
LPISPEQTGVNELHSRLLYHYQYSLGATLYEMLDSPTAFEIASALELASATLSHYKQPKLTEVDRAIPAAVSDNRQIN